MTMMSNKAILPSEMARGKLVAVRFDEAAMRGLERLRKHVSSRFPGAPEVSVGATIKIAIAIALRHELGEEASLEDETPTPRKAKRR